MTITNQRVLRSNIKEKKFSPSFLDDFRCMRKGLLSRGLGLTLRENSVHQIAGSAVHLGVGTFYSERSNRSHEKSASLGIDAMVDFWEENSKHLKVRDDKKNIENLCRILTLYFETYKHDTASFPKEYIELPVEIPMPNGTSLVMVIDRVRVEGSHACVVDTKTSGWSLTQYFFRKFENDFQTTAYYYAIVQHLGHCESIQIDGIHIPKESYALKDETVRREQFLRSPLQVEDWLNTYIILTNRIMEGFSIEDEIERTKFFYCDQSRCGDYGGCSYLPVCQYGMNTPEVQVLFEQKKGGVNERSK